MGTSDKPKKNYRVKIEVISQKGHCFAGHKVGDSWIADHLTPSGICGEAYGALGPRLQTLRYGGSFHWQGEDEGICVCVDPTNPVVFRLTRIKE
jgi:uncharacterized repeat protein (TIGR04076 family)